MELIVGGEKINIDTFESENGFVAINIEDKDLEKIEVEYKTPKEYKIAYIISIISFIIGIIYIIIQMLIKNNNKNEYLCAKLEKNN